MATSVNYDMDQGADFSFTLTIKSENGTPKNISSEYEILCQMRKYYTSSNYVTFTPVMVDGTYGQVKIQMGGTATSEIKPGVYFYDVELIASRTNPIEPNARYRVQQGMITVYPEVTR